MSRRSSARGTGPLALPALLLPRSLSARRSSGTSAHGSVFKGVQKRTNAVLAIKEITDLDDSDAIKSEIDILKKCKHPNIVSYYGTITKQEQGSLWVPPR